MEVLEQPVVKLRDSRHVSSLELELATGNERLEQASHVLHLPNIVASCTAIACTRPTSAALTALGTCALEATFIRCLLDGRRATDFSRVSLPAPLAGRVRTRRLPCCHLRQILA
eukprot:5578900-Prymnesium_polylepis.2